MNANDAGYPKISVVTPSFNQGRYIESTINSVLNQDYPNLEYIIMDGGSLDETVEIIERYSEHLAYWESQPDEGQTDALIKGFARATGDIMCWLCSDDLFENRTLLEVAKIFDEHPDWQVIYGDSFWIDADGRPLRFKREIPYNRFIWMYDHNYFPQPSTFWRRGIYEQVGGLDPRMRLAMDGDLWARFAEHTTPRHVPRAWSRMRYYPEQKNLRLRSTSDEEDAQIRSRYLGDEPPWLRRLKWFPAKGLRVSLKLARGAYW